MDLGYDPLNPDDHPPETITDPTTVTEPITITEPGDNSTITITETLQGGIILSVSAGVIVIGLSIAVAVSRRRKNT